MPRRFTLSSLVLILSLTWLDAARADQLFIKVTGQKQGLLRLWYNPIATLDGVDLSDYGLITDQSWSVISPRDPASGLPTGKRIHHPLALRVRMSRAVLLLGNALTDNENLPAVEVRWFRHTGTDPYVAGQKLWLINANLASLSMYTVREQDELVTYADFTMTYQTIGIEDPDGGISYIDDWETPVQ